jgi:hypothetical protein
MMVVKFLPPKMIVLKKASSQKSKEAQWKTEKWSGDPAPLKVPKAFP